MMLLQLSHEYYSNITNNEFTFPLKCRAYRLNLEIIPRSYGFLFIEDALEAPVNCALK